MCGIAGVFHQPDDHIIRDMVREISHRGPDGQAVENMKWGTLGHARLAILDLEGGHQPNEILYITNTLHNTNLQRADQMSMAFGLEARDPFSDVESVSLAMSLPACWKLHCDRVPKALLCRACADDLPAEIVNRPKA